jgi:hypothetical protein
MLKNSFTGIIKILFIHTTVNRYGCDMGKNHWVHKNSLTPPLFIEVPVPSYENEW